MPLGWRTSMTPNDQPCTHSFIHTVIHIVIHTFIHMFIHMAIHMFIHMNVDVFQHLNEGMNVCSLIHLSKCQDIWAHTWMDKWMYNWISIPSFYCIYECLFIHRSHQMSLCASVTMSVCKKIIENQPFLNISDMFLNISQLYFRSKTIVRGADVIISNQAACE